MKEFSLDQLIGFSGNNFFCLDIDGFLQVVIVEILRIIKGHRAAVKSPDELAVFEF